MPLGGATELKGHENTAFTGDSDKKHPLEIGLVKVQVTEKPINNGDIIPQKVALPADQEFCEEEDLPCRWGPCLKLSCCAGCRNTKVVLLLLCCAAFVQGMVINGFINSIITSLEKRFELKSADTGLIASCYDIASVICLIPISYFGGIGSKPRWLGFGIILMGLGSVVFAIPHYTTGLYSQSSSFTDLTVTDGCNTEVQTSNVSLTDILCEEKEESSLSNYKYVLMLGQLLHGMGATPLYTLGVTYMHENVKQTWSSIYTGIFYAMSVLGPAVGFILGGYFVSFYTDFDKEDVTQLGITTESVSWVGAWWLGFLLGGAMAVVIGVIILGFPATLPGYAKIKAERISESHGGETGVTNIQSGFSGLKDFPQSLRVLLTNPTFILVCLGGAGDGVVTSGVATFLPKYLEFQFNQSSSFAAILVGLSVVPSGGGGMILGGYLVKRFSLSVRGTLRFCLVVSVLSMVTALTVLIKCDDVKLAGVNHRYVNSTETSEVSEFELTSNCNAACACDNAYFRPVCGSDQVMYFTACSAGCGHVSEEGGQKVYANCSCVETSVGDTLVLGSATEGRCSPDCKLLIAFMVILSLNIFIGYSAAMPALSATLRCVPLQQCSFALGIQWIVIRCLGTIPGPIIFGAIIDASCLFWRRPCEDSDDDGACYYYNNENMRYYFLGIIISLRFLSGFFYFLSSVCYKAPPEKEIIECNIGDTINTVKNTESGEN